VERDSDLGRARRLTTQSSQPPACFAPFLIPVVAIVLGWVMLGEAPSSLALAGGALCVGGVYVARR